MHIRTIVAAAIVIAVAAITPPSSLAADAFLIRHARVFDGEKVVDDVDVFVRDGVIQQVGKDLDAGGAKAIDASGKTLLPGLINDRSNQLVERPRRRMGDARPPVK